MVKLVLGWVESQNKTGKFGIWVVKLVLRWVESQNKTGKFGIWVVKLVLSWVESQNKTGKFGIWVVNLVLSWVADVWPQTVWYTAIRCSSPPLQQSAPGKRSFILLLDLSLSLSTTIWSTWFHLEDLIHESMRFWWWLNLQSCRGMGLNVTLFSFTGADWVQCPRSSPIQLWQCQVARLLHGVLAISVVRLLHGALAISVVLLCHDLWWGWFHLRQLLLDLLDEVGLRVIFGYPELLSTKNLLLETRSSKNGSKKNGEP